MAKKKKSAASGDKAQLRFEEALGELEQIVRELEDGTTGLAESLQRYEDGVKLLKSCYQLLENAERRIELLSGVDADGNPVTEPFDDAAGEESLESKSRSRGRRRSTSRSTTPKGRSASNVDRSAGLF